MAEELSIQGRTKILVVCMVDSIHAARWLQQFENEELDFFVFPSGPNRLIHTDLIGLRDSNGPATYEFHRAIRYGLLLWALDKFLGNLLRGALLNFWIRQVGPDVVHAIEIQGAGYLALRAKASIYESSAKLLVTNYGSDIFWFGNFSSHKLKIEQLMGLADYYSAECERDVALAKKHGFRGHALPVIPNAGGVELPDPEVRRSLEARNTISVKGYHGWVGRAHTALRALALIRDEVSGYTIEVFSANFTTRLVAMYLRRAHKLSVRVFSKNSLSHLQMQELFGRSRVYVGISKSDGISTSMLEAMANGAIPVQTSTACCDEWFSSSGVAIRELSAEAVADGILQALRLSSDGKSARINRDTIESRAGRSDVSEVARTFYKIVNQN